MKKKLIISLLIPIIAINSCKENSNNKVSNEIKEVTEIENETIEPKSDEYIELSNYLMDNTLERYFIEKKTDKFGEIIFAPNFETFAECKFSSINNTFTILEDREGLLKYSFDLIKNKMSIVDSKGNTINYILTKTDYGIVFISDRIVDFKPYVNGNFTIKTVGFILRDFQDENRSSIPNEIK